MRIREAEARDAAAIAHVHVRTWQTTYRGMISDAYLDALEMNELENRRGMWERIITRGGWVRVAEIGDEIVGFVNAGPTRDDPPAAVGEVYAIYVLARHHKKGIGAALFRAALAAFPSVSLWVVKGNPTGGFYRHMGGVPDISKIDEIGGVAITELRYIWKPGI